MTLKSSQSINRETKSESLHALVYPSDKNLINDFCTRHNLKISELVIMGIELAIEKLEPKNINKDEQHNG